MKEVVPEQCERFRESISLGLDGLLSTFETALLDRHLSRCPTCHTYAADVAAQTELLRSAAFEQPLRPVVVAPAAHTDLRRRAYAVAGAVAVAVAAALIAFTPVAGQRSATISTNHATRGPLLAVFPASPTTNATFDVPRLRVVSPDLGDGPVRGYFGVPASA